MKFRSDLIKTKFCRHTIVHMIHGDASVLWSSWLWVCLFYALNVTGPASKSQIPQRGEEVFHFLLKEAIAVFLRPHGPVQSFSVWSQAFVFFFSPAPSLAQVSPSAHTSLNSTLPACRGQNTDVWVDNTDITTHSYLWKRF